MPSRGLGAYQVKIHQIVFGGLFFLVVLMGVKTMMSGGTGNLKTLAALSVAVGVVLSLDKYYWVLCPFLFASGITLPGLRFDARELGCLALIGVYFIRQAMHKEHPFKLTGPLLAALPIFCWICFIWFLNPTGMAMLGSETIGARFYFKVVLGFGALTVLSALRFSEKDCKILFFTLLVSALISFVKTVLASRLGGWVSGDEFETDTARYDLLGVLPLYYLLFSRYGLAEISTSLWKFTTAVVVAGITVYTGKRSAFGTLAIIPFLRCFLTGRDKMITVVWSVVGVFMLAMLIAGHETFYELPYSAKRALGVVIPSFAQQTAGGSTDLFREGVRRYGREVIRSSPWVGRKGFSMDRGETSWMLFSGTGDVYSGHAFSGNWHSAWYAFACDFGLPALFLWAGFMLYMAGWTYSTIQKLPTSSFQTTMFIYYAYSLYVALIFSYTSGHSAKSAMYTWIVAGMLVAISNGARDQHHVPNPGVT